MHNHFVEDKTFDKVNFKEIVLLKGEYENCIFTTCDFSDTDLSNVQFVSCKFDYCNLSMALLGNTAFKNVTLILKCSACGLIIVTKWHLKLK